MILSIIIPAFNEENTIEEIIKKIGEVSLPVEKEIIVVNDGSTDKTSGILERIKDDFNIVLLNHEKNQGKTASIKTAIPFIKGNIAIIQDADLELSPEDYPELINPIIKGWAKVVYGSRILAGKENKNNKKNWPLFLGGKFLTFLANSLYGLNITDEPIGYKVFKSEILKSINLEHKGFEFCPEVTAKVAKMGIKIYEVPVSYSPRTKSEGKKVRLWDGLKAIWVLLKYKFK
jgi:glycosyltransferase involved in cell wall biosynthesis